MKVVSEFDQLCTDTKYGLLQNSIRNRSPFLSLTRSDILKQWQLKEGDHELYQNKLAIWVKFFFLVSDQEIENKFRSLGLNEFVFDAFVHIDTIIKKLKLIRQRNIIELDYFSVIVQIIDYLEMKIMASLFANSDTMIIYGGKKINGFKVEMLKLKNKFKRKSTSPTPFQVDLWHEINKPNHNGITEFEIYDSMFRGRFDEFFFQKIFLHFVRKVDQETSDADMFIELYDLLRIVTRDPLLVPANKYNVDLHGYENLRKYQYMHMLRLLLPRT